MTEADGPKLIFDIGLHHGEDAEFYLRKGFRVVGVDANPDMCALASERLATFVEPGDLIVLNRAIDERPGKVTFFKNAETSWGTVDRRWAERNARFGLPPTGEQTVEAVTLADLVEQFGVPYYVKIDIEGRDLTALKSLASCRRKPEFVSLESDKVSFAALREEFGVLRDLGYDKFKIVPQHEVVRQTPPYPAKEGGYVDHAFQWGSSGLFGEEAPGKWLSADEAIEKYKRIFLRYHLWGDDPLVGSRLTRAILRRALGAAGWHDTHARLGATG